MSEYLSEAAVYLDRQRQKLQEELDRATGKILKAQRILQKANVMYSPIMTKIEDTRENIWMQRKAIREALEALDDHPEPG